MAEVVCDNYQYLDDFGIEVGNYYTSMGWEGRIGKSSNASLHALFNATEIKNKLTCTEEEARFQVR